MQLPPRRSIASFCVMMLKTPAFKKALADPFTLEGEAKKG